MASIALILQMEGNEFQPRQVYDLNTWTWLWVYFLWSRCAEICFAFLRDATEKLTKQPKSSSTLLWGERLKLALKSYIELVANFSVLYWILPGTYTVAPRRFSDLIYFSATTITTSGNGLIIPTSIGIQILSTFEVFTGIILLVVCFTIYVAHALNEP